MRIKRINTELYDTITVTDKSGNAIDFSTAYDIHLYLQKQGSSSLLQQDFALSGSGSPITNAIVPDFVGQIYIDTTNRNAYMCCDSSSAGYWKLIN